MQLTVQTLTPSRHNRKTFDCGEPALNDFFRKFAGNHGKNYLSRTYVLLDLAVSEQNPIGFFTLASKEVIPPLGSKLKYPAPGILLGRMAVDQGYQGRSLGKYLLADAISRSARSALNEDTPPHIGLFVDMKHTGLKDFYTALGFKPVSEDSDELRLWLSVGECLQFYQAQQKLFMGLQQ